MHKKRKVTQEDFLLSLKKRQNARGRLIGRRIGVYAGVFNPVHAGHIAFALQAMQSAKLDQIVFLPERLPRHKPDVEHFGHRVAMLQRAIQPYENMAVLELVDKQFTVHRTLPQLQNAFAGATLVFLLGSDAIAHLPHWPDAKKLLTHSELVVGVRSGHEVHKIKSEISKWRVQPNALYVLQSFSPHVSSTEVRNALRERKTTAGLLTSVKKYARRNWLYVSLEKAEKNV